MSKSLICCFLLGCCFYTCCGETDGAEQKTATQKAAKMRPNIVLIFADDLGYGDLGCYGAMKLKTPNIDKLARAGRMFTDAHSASAVCSPSRYALMTGKYPFRKNLFAPVFLRAPMQIDTKRQTLASLLKLYGYETACIGKWHLGFGKKTPNWNGDLKPGPLEVGFDYYFGVPVVNSHPPFVYVENHRVVGLDPNDPFVYGKRAKTVEYPEKLRLGDIGGAQKAHDLYRDEEVGMKLTEKAVEFIRKKRKNPFFLYLATTNIHHPFTPAKRFQKTSKAGRYGDYVHELDWIVGQVLAELDKQGIADETLVIFTSDNGGMLNLGGQSAWRAGHRLNGVLLGFKFGAWEGGHRVPFIVRWPGKVPPNTQSDQLICNIDMFATFAAVISHKTKQGEGPDSVNVLPAFVGSPKQALRDHLIIAPFRRTHLTLRQGKWVYIPSRGSGGFGGVRGGPGALAFTGEKNSDITGKGKFRKNAPNEQLYNLETDLSQSTNVVTRYPKIAAKMRAFLQMHSNAPVGAKPKLKQLIDTHIHLYDPRRPKGIPWPPPDDKILYKPHLPQDFKRVAKPAGVTGVIITEASDRPADNRWVLDLVKNDNFFVALVGNIDPYRKDFAKYLNDLRKDPRFVGIRARLSNKKINYRDPQVLANFRLLAKAQLTLDILMNGEGVETIQEIDRLAQTFPD